MPIALGIKSDGTCVAAGRLWGGLGQTWVIDVSGWTDIIDGHAMSSGIVGVKANGQCVYTGALVTTGWDYDNGCYYPGNSTTVIPTWDLLF